jgi:hypothetical protein
MILKRLVPGEPATIQLQGTLRNGRIEGTRRVVDQKIDLSSAEGSFWHGIIHRQELDAWIRRLGCFISAGPGIRASWE